MTSSVHAEPLGDAALGALDERVATPGYDRSRVRAGIVHIGVGGFHRAHLATYADELCAQGHLEWGICGCGVLPSDARMAEVLTTQDGLYTMIVRSAGGSTVQIVGSIVEFIHAHPDPATAIERIADPATQVVSLTITEGGYPIDDLTGAYLPDSPNAGPGSAFALVAAGLERRRLAHGAPITVMSCDNVMSNGHVARAATLGEADAIGDELEEPFGTDPNDLPLESFCNMLEIECRTRLGDTDLPARIMPVNDLIL